MIEDTRCHIVWCGKNIETSCCTNQLMNAHKSSIDGLNSCFNEQWTVCKRELMAQKRHGMC